jgi:hypothetical protein
LHSIANHARSIEKDWATGVLWHWKSGNNRLIAIEGLMGCDIDLKRPLSRQASDTAQQESQMQAVHNLGESGYGRYIEIDQ